MPAFKSFAHRGAHFRIRSDRFAACVAEIRRQRQRLEAYLVRHPAFGRSLAPLPLLPEAPEIAIRMQQAAAAVGVGPMAAVAGAMAEFAARAALAAGANEAIVDNGGDIFIHSPQPLALGIYAGTSPLSGQLAFQLQPADLPLAICSSSSTMGHSLSLGRCDLATVVAADAALADAAATQAANLVRAAADLDHALERIAAIPGVAGLLVIVGDRIGLRGNLPELIRNADATTLAKVTRAPGVRLPPPLPRQA